MEMAKRARTAETPKQTSHPLRPHAPHFYPDSRTSGSRSGRWKGAADKAAIQRVQVPPRQLPVTDA